MEGNEPFVTKQDNVVLSDLLYFLINKFHTHPMETIINVCEGLYDDKIVAEKKTKFLNAVSRKCPARRTHDKKRKDQEDILTENKSSDKAGEPPSKSRRGYAP